MHIPVLIEKLFISHGNEIKIKQKKYIEMNVSIFRQTLK